VISFAEFEVAILGLLRLARFDAGFAGFFDLSSEGARRSFRLALPLVPLSLFLSHLGSEWPADTDVTRVVCAELIGNALAWVSFPLLLLVAQRLIDRGNRVYAAITIYNWLSVLLLAFYVPIILADYYGIVAGTMTGYLLWGALLFVTASEFFAFKLLLAIRTEMTIALVVVDFVLSRMIDLLVIGMAHGPLF
jgi:hypothetical protein